MNTEEKLAEIDKKIKLMSIIDAPGAIMVGLGLYGKFGANGNAFHPLLNDMNIVHPMLGIGAVIMGWCGYQVLTLSREKSRLMRDLG